MLNRLPGTPRRGVDNRALAHAAVFGRPRVPGRLSGAAGVSRVSDTTYDSKAALEAVSVAAVVQIVLLEGFASSGDGGMAHYKRAISEPSHTGKVRSLDRYLPNGTVDASNGGWWEIDEYTQNSAMFGCTSSADCATGLNAMVACVKAQGARHMVLAPFQHSIGAIVTFDPPDHSKLTFLGTIRPTFTGGTAVRIGSTATNIFYLDINGIHVTRAALDLTQTGVHLTNLVACKIGFSTVQNFVTGVSATGTQANGGFSYNKIYLGLHHDSQFNLFLDASSSGYINENDWYGGSFNHSTAWTAGALATTATTNITIDDFASSPPNNNRFWGPSLEDNNDPAFARAMNISGSFNVVLYPRMENAHTPASYFIALTADSEECTVIADGFAANATNVIDSGTANTVSTRDGITIKKQSGAGVAVHTVQSVASSSAKLYRGLDSAGAEAFSVTGTGVMNLVGSYQVDGTQVLSNRAAAVANASGGATIDAEARTALNSLLAKLRTHGIIAT